MLDPKKKMFVDTIKMIAYRSETAMAMQIKISEERFRCPSVDSQADKHRGGYYPRCWFRPLGGASSQDE